MSYNYLHLIPTDYNYVPSSEQIQRAVSIISENPLESEPDVVISDNVEFVDSRSNMEAVYCPQCGLKLEWAWWGDAMDRAFKTGFRDLSIDTPCRGLATSLNDLRYVWPCGFARFRISFLSPGRDLDPSRRARCWRSRNTPSKDMGASLTQRKCTVCGCVGWDCCPALALGAGPCYSVSAAQPSLNSRSAWHERPRNGWCSKTACDGK